VCTLVYMSQSRVLRRRALLLAGLAVTLVLTGCSASVGDNAAVTLTSTAKAVAAASMAPVASAEPGKIEVVAPQSDVEITGPASASASVGSAAPATSEAAATTKAPRTATLQSAPTPAPTPQLKPKPKPKPAARVSTGPGPRATDVDPVATISVAAQGGILLWVKVINPEGKVVGGGTVNKTTWSWLPELGFGRQYIVRSASRSTAGVFRVSESTFTTLKPKKLVTISVSPAGGQTVGVGQPVIFRFSEPIADASRRFVERQITIERTIGQPGAFRWFSSTEMHWRPQQFWKAGSIVKVSLDIYGKQLSPGLYGAQDGKREFKIGRRMTTEVDANTHQLHVYRDFRLIKSFPVSLGNDKYPTRNGTHVVSQKLAKHVMDSSTWGLVGAGAYRTEVKWATRISDSGEFVHGAPWSVYAQGKSNVSHGCINASDANAEWFLKTSLIGDPVTVQNSKGATLDPGDGIGDWNIPWGKY
jgi:lipoprotein-anchoring transpeptidase ErfK/SrfK